MPSTGFVIDRKSKPGKIQITPTYKPANPPSEAPWFKFEPSAPEGAPTSLSTQQAKQGNGGWTTDAEFDTIPSLRVTVCPPGKDPKDDPGGATLEVVNLYFPDLNTGKTTTLTFSPGTGPAPGTPNANGEVNDKPGGQDPYKPTSFKPPPKPMDKVVKSASITVGGQPFADWFNGPFRAAFSQGGYATDNRTYTDARGGVSHIAEHTINKDNFQSMMNTFIPMMGPPISIAQFVGVAFISYNETGGLYVPIAERKKPSKKNGIGLTAEELAVELDYFLRYNNGGNGNKKAGDQLVEKGAQLTPEQVEAWNKASTKCPDRDHDQLAKECDFYKFRGRGFNQLTGRSNYTRLKDSIGVDVEQSSEEDLTRRFMEVSNGAAFKVLFNYNKSIMHHLTDASPDGLFPNFAAFGRATGGPGDYGDFSADRARRVLVEMLRAGVAFG